MNMDSVHKINMAPALLLPVLFWTASENTDLTLSHPNLRHLMETRTYDLVIMEIFVTEAIIGLGQHFDAPVIAVSTFGASKWCNDLVGSPSPPSYVAHSFSTFTHRMTFVQRLMNYMLHIYETALLHLINYPAQRRSYRKAFPNARVSYEEALANVSFVLLNSHHSINVPRPYLPNMVEVGGMHVPRNTKPLPDRLQRFLDSATDGAIYFSLGSVVKSTMLSQETRNIFINVFGSLRQKVIWKFEEQLVGQPENVLTGKWLPQNDILAHPNVKLFMTHGGLLSTTESVYHGVPVIGMPVFGDQMRNIEAAVQFGWALRLDHSNVTETSLRWALEKALGDESITLAAKTVSKRYRDQPMTPLDTAVYWTEYVLRHNGAPHLRSASIDLNFWQYHSLDVLAILLLTSALGCILFVALVRCCIRRRRQRAMIATVGKSKGE